MDELTEEVAILRETISRLNRLLFQTVVHVCELERRVDTLELGGKVDE